MDPASDKDVVDAVTTALELKSPTAEGVVEAASPTSTVTGEGELMVETSTGENIVLQLPDSAQQGQRLDGDTLAFESALPDVTFAAQTTVAGGARGLIVLEGPDAATRYEFDMELLDGATTFARQDGSIEIVDREGFTLGAVLPPWARDAKGAELLTRYEIDGDTLIQHIDHEGDAYPVLADPDIEVDCGIINCTFRLDREATALVASASAVSEVIEIVCSPIPDSIQPLCEAGLSAAPIVSLINDAAAFNADGDCIAIRLPFYQPIRVDAGTFNCQASPPPTTAPPIQPVETVEDALEQLQPTLGLDDEELAGATAALSADPALAAQFIANLNGILALAPAIPLGPGLIGLIASTIGVLATAPLWAIVAVVLAVVVLAVLLYLIVDWSAGQAEIDAEFDRIVERLREDEPAPRPTVTIVPLPDPAPEPDYDDQTRRCREVASAANVGPSACETLPIYFVGEIDMQGAAVFRGDAISQWPRWGRQNRLLPVPDPQRSWLWNPEANGPFAFFPDRGWPDARVETDLVGCLQTDSEGDPVRPGERGDGLYQCDEFPNASMNEWGPRGPEKPHAALRWVTTAENQYEGSWIRQFYDTCGIANGDPFLVVPLVSSQGTPGLTDFVCAEESG